MSARDQRAASGPDPGSFGGHPYTPDEIALGYGTDHDPRDSAAANGYRVRCTVCGREQMSGASPLTNGWPKCCGYTMRLEDNERFKADIDEAVAAAFAPMGSVFDGR